MKSRYCTFFDWPQETSPGGIIFVFAAVALSRFMENGSLLVRQARFPTTQDPFLHSNSR